MPHQASVEAGPRKLWDADLQAAKNVIEWMQRAPAEADDHHLLNRCEHCALGVAVLWEHPRSLHETATS